MKYIVRDYYGTNLTELSLNVRPFKGEKIAFFSVTENCSVEYTIQKIVHTEASVFIEVED